MNKLSLLAAIAMLVPAPAGATEPLAVVAAENFYGDVAQQIGGPKVRVTSILGNPDQDPHLFEASPSVARALTAARIVIYNGIGYDPWMARLLHAVGNPDRKVIVVAELVGGKPGDNPHLWYDPKTMPALAAALADELGRSDPPHRADYLQRLAQFRQSLGPIEAAIGTLHERLAGTSAAATEPIFGYMFAALGMSVSNQRFQRAVMNNTEPSAADVAALEDDLKNHKVRLLVYNSQVSDPLTLRIVKIAAASRIPVVGVTETHPPDKTYQAWMLSALDAVNRALPK